MRIYIIGAALAFLVAGQAMAGNSECEYNCKPAGTTVNNTFKPVNVVYTDTDISNSNSQSQQQQQQQKQKQHQSQGQSQSSYNDNSNQGNAQTVSFNDVRQAPPVSSYVAASGPCIGTSGSAGASVIGVGVSIGFASVESDCRKDEHIRIGLASGDPTVRAAAIQDWLAMNDDLFGKKKSTSTQTSALAPAPATEQTASLPEPALPKGQTRN